MSPRIPGPLLLLLLLLPLTSAQISIRNFGCKTYSANNTCAFCSNRYYLDPNAICQPVNPYCNAYNSTTGGCTSCYPGFGLIEDACLPGVLNFDPNCNTFRDALCTVCSKGFYLAVNAKCTAANPACNTYSLANGSCTACFAGYEVQAGNCVLSKQVAIANCNSIDPKTGKCLKCSIGFYFDANGFCLQQNPNCKTFNPLLSLCLQCYLGYDLKNNDCQKSAAKAVDPNCKIFNLGQCAECSKGAIFNPNRICIVVDPLCLSFDQNDGSCTSCYPGYALANKSCTLSKQKNTADAYCRTFITKDKCGQCFTRFFVGQSGKCQQISSFCKTYNPLNGSCLSCYPGFTLAASLCQVSTAEVIDPNCKSWNGSLCTQCAFRAYFLPNGTCAAVNPLCKTYNKAYGNCLSCYDSFELKGGGCLKSNRSISDQNCAEFQNKLCARCSSGFIFLDSGLCGSVSPNCKQYSNLTGKCTSCYMGYDLTNGSCLLSTDSTSLDANCAVFKDGKCIACSKNFYFSTKGLCWAVDPLCNGFNASTGACLGCYQGYVLREGKCMQDKNNSFNDPSCASWLQGVCISCATRTFMNRSGLCQSVSINCNTFSNVDGLCTSCFPGFSLNKGSCQLSLSPSSCSQFNKDGSCGRCGQGSYLSAGQCISIDPQCANFDKAALLCVSCYSGYSTLNGVCQISKVDSRYQIENCYAYDQRNVCIKCYERYYFDGNGCQAVNLFCKSYDDNTGDCLTCYSTFALKNGACSADS